ncbi:hypothetical protein [Kitasatospora phosalacinea]|uniref:hypothetical protein n=1 Tax=Kitasatospora phosalacinea TaxID=2065 RepID=UPI000A9AAA4C|nr:hypothetical protein [Kitasatospora phosalacinea]
MTFPRTSPAAERAARRAARRTTRRAAHGPQGFCRALLAVALAALAAVLLVQRP